MKQWKIVCSPEAFERWRNEESFHHLLALARVVNSIRFTHHALLGSHRGETPADMRQRLNSFMYTGALLFEGIQLSKKLGKHWRHLPAFREGFQEIHKDSAVEELVTKYLKPLRNEAVFHFDVSSVAASLKLMADPEYSFVRGAGRRSGFTYFDLADASALRIVFGSRSDPDYIDRTRQLITAVTELAVRFISASDTLLGQALDHSDWVLVEVHLGFWERMKKLARTLKRRTLQVWAVLTNRL